jgi:hypothetical protein
MKISDLFSIIGSDVGLGFIIYAIFIGIDSLSGIAFILLGIASILLGMSGEKK